jgi:hypothetical protein
MSAAEAVREQIVSHRLLRVRGGADIGSSEGALFSRRQGPDHGREGDRPPLGQPLTRTCRLVYGAGGGRA